MKIWLQFGMAVLALAGSLALAPAGFAQKPAHSSPPAPAPHPAQAHPQNQNPNRPPNASNASSATHPNVNPNANVNANRPPQSYKPQTNFNPQNRPNGGNGTNLNQRPQSGAGAARPWVDTMRDLTPGQREQVLQKSQVFQQLPPDKQSKIRQQFSQWDKMTPQQQADLRAKEHVWRGLTPGQRDYIKNSANPRFQQLPWQRQQVVQQKLGVLQNMPESARNQRLNDPNFTRGMSDDEKSVLRELAHTHVGGPPEAPPE